MRLVLASSSRAHTDLSTRLGWRKRGSSQSFTGPRNAEIAHPVPGVGDLCECLSGGVLLSHTVTSAVPSALKGLASGFGMGPGVSPSLWPP